MIVTDCSLCSNVQCLNQVSNVASQVNLTCSYYSHFSTKYTCCPSDIMSTEPITIPSEFAQYSNVNVVVNAMAGSVYSGLMVYTCVDCLECMDVCPKWDLNVYYKSDTRCYETSSGCCRCVISFTKVPASYAGSCIYIGVNAYDACVIDNKITINLVPEA